jgi:hypothetical protein
MLQKIGLHLSVKKIESLFSSALSFGLGKNFFRNLLDNTSQVWIELAGIELYHNLALSFKEKGKRINLIPS